MSEMVDHAAEARLWADNAVKAQAARKEPKNEELATAYAAIAQVHATLALVEQQRVANLLALSTWHVEGSDGSEQGVMPEHALALYVRAARAMKVEEVSRGDHG